MILIDIALAGREALGQPIRLALLGAGFHGAARVGVIAAAKTDLAPGEVITEFEEVSGLRCRREKLRHRSRRPIGPEPCSRRRPEPPGPQRSVLRFGDVKLSPGRLVDQQCAEQRSGFGALDGAS
jgi:predicted homoserine dehydrogenase-like protein